MEPLYILGIAIAIMTAVNIGILIACVSLCYLMNKQYTEIFKERSISARIRENG